MRIAISGTHCCGKTTLVDAFLVRHADYLHEPEAYESLQDLHGESFSDEPSAEEFFRQLEYQVGRLAQYQVDHKVIFERSPADYLAYLLALERLGRTNADSKLVPPAIDVVKESLFSLDLIVFLPLKGFEGDSRAAEDPKLRRAVDDLLEDILLNDEFDLLTANGQRVVELVGSTSQRLQALESNLR